MEGLIRDFRYSARTLLKEPGFTAVAVLTLALGIGANTAVYSLADQVLLRPLPVANPERLVVLRMPGPKTGSVWSDDMEGGAQSFSWPFYQGLRQAAPSPFVELLARFSCPVSVGGRGGTERATAELISGSYFATLGVQPALGRILRLEDESAAMRQPVVVLSHGYWSRRFGADPAILGQDVLVNGRAMTVVGVSSAGFKGIQLGRSTDLFLPITLKALMTPNWDGLNDRNDSWLQMIGRLEPGISRAQAEAALSPLTRPLLEQDLAVIKGMAAEERGHFRAKKILLLPGARGRAIVQDEMRDRLLLLAGLVGLLLLIACANVANLLIARGAARRKEIAVRLALGASRAQLMRQLLAESLLLALAGGALGLLVASWSIDAMLALFPAGSGTAVLSGDLDGRILAFNFGAVLFTALLSGILPAFRATRPDLTAAIKDQGTGTGTGRLHVRLRQGLVTAQIAFTTILLVTAGLFSVSLWKLRRVDVGMRVDRLLAFSVEPALFGYAPPQTVALLDRIRRDAAALPGVAGATAAEIAVLANSSAGYNMTVEGYDAGQGGVQVGKNSVGPRYFETMGVPLLLGREFLESDAAVSPKVAVINETFRRRCFAGRDALGRHVAFGSGSGVKLDIEIVGVAKNSRNVSVRQEEGPFIYVPYAQDPSIGAATFYVRSSRPAAALVPALREQVRRSDAVLPVLNVKTLIEQRDESLTNERLLAVLSICFGLVASLLAAIGLYGTMSYTVLRRTSEIGIRMALGASARGVRALVLREALVMTAVGLGVGLPASWAAARLARSLLFRIQPHDPFLLGAAALLLLGIMLLAAYLPARRASRVDPLVALRAE
jgi:putative ABC transport system permease protein